MILQRKNTAPTVQTRDGVTHPELVLAVTNVNQDRKQKTLQISFDYYHSKQLYLEGFLPVFGGFTFVFNKDGRAAETDSKGVVTRASFPSYSKMMNDITISDEGVIMGTSADWEKWIINQIECLDLTGLLVKDNWKVDPDFRYVVL